MENYVRTCDICARNKPVHHAPYGLLSPLPTPIQPSFNVFLDWITDLPTSDYYDAILMVVDRLTKEAQFIKRFVT